MFPKTTKDKEEMERKLFFSAGGSLMYVMVYTRLDVVAQVVGVVIGSWPILGSSIGLL